MGSWTPQGPGGSLLNSGVVKFVTLPSKSVTASLCRQLSSSLASSHAPNCKFGWPIRELCLWSRPTYGMRKTSHTFEVGGRSLRDYLIRHLDAFALYTSGMHPTVDGVRGDVGMSAIVATRDLFPSFLVTPVTFMWTSDFAATRSEFSEFVANFFGPQVAVIKCIAKTGKKGRHMSLTDNHMFVSQ